jgi:uncharacterized membrane protein
MVDESTTDPQRADTAPNPVALSLTGGAIGTITGLRRGGLPGAITGGLVGGTAGYLVGAAGGAQSIDIAEPADVSDPISIETDEPATDTATSDSDADTADDTDQ